MAALKLLVRKGIALEQKGLNAGHTPFHLAAEQRTSKMVTVLLELGANINAVDIYGHTALHLAAGKGRKDTARLLIDRGIALGIAGQGDPTDTAEKMATNTANFEIAAMIRGANGDRATPEDVMEGVDEVWGIDRSLNKKANNKKAEAEGGTGAVVVEEVIEETADSTYQDDSTDQDNPDLPTEHGEL